MPMSKVAKERRRAARACGRKTAKGNRYATRGGAEAALRSMLAAGKGERAEVYPCAACGAYHLGRPAAAEAPARPAIGGEGG